MGKAPQWPGLHPEFDSQLAETNHRMTVGQRGHAGCHACPSAEASNYISAQSHKYPCRNTSPVLPPTPQGGGPCLIHHANQPAFPALTQLHIHALAQSLHLIIRHYLIRRETVLLRKINERQPPWLQVLAQLLWAARQWAMRAQRMKSPYRKHLQAWAMLLKREICARIGFSSPSVTLHSRKALSLSCI